MTPVGDDIGPAKIVLIRTPRVGLEAIVVVDNVACGPAIGGVRMAVDVTVDEVARLARAMTWKNAAAGLAHGGGKAGIVADPRVPAERREELIRAFARSIADVRDYIPGPDMGTDERCMAWVQDEIRRAVGLPRVFGGIPLDEIGATGLGLAAAAEVAAPAVKIELPGARVAIEGFGAVGQHAARFLARRGTRQVAATDSTGGIEAPAGLDIDALIRHKRDGAPLHTFPGGRPLARENLCGVACDIWIPAPRPDTLTAENVGRLSARLVLQGANIPATVAQDLVLVHPVLGQVTENVSWSRTASILRLPPSREGTWGPTRKHQAGRGEDGACVHSRRGEASSGRWTGCSIG